LLMQAAAAVAKALPIATNRLSVRAFIAHLLPSAMPRR
jgi:hypothetical protein